jgi:hypothetical protein
LNEEKCICEATGNKREVSRDEIFDVMDAQEDKGNGGKFATIVYVTCAGVYASKKAWRPDDVTAALDATRDEYGDTDWHKNITSYNDPSVKTMTKNPIAGVICVTRYQIHWQTKDSYDKDYTEYATKRHDILMRRGIAIQSDGMLGNNNNQRQNVNGTQINQTGRPSRDFDIVGSKLLGVKFYETDEEGNILGEIPAKVAYSMKPLPSEWKGPSDVTKKLSGQELEDCLRELKELDDKHKFRNFLFDGILAIVANENGQSYYYINDKVCVNSYKGGAKYPAIQVNPQDMISIAQEAINQSFNGIDGFAQDNSGITPMQ